VTRWICVLALLAGLNPLGALAQEPSLPDETTAEGALQYDAPVATQDADPDKPLVPSFQRRTATKAGGPANELNTGDRRATEKPAGGDIAAAITGRDLFHGNFCGYGNRGANLAPTDELDAACKRHDECFDSTNRSCSCNAALKRDAYRVSELRTASRELRTRAVSVIEAIPAMDCH
jgi:hypothetical protein